ncbi:MAG: hypothetical protein AB1696_23375 [Planctomycetota bacterium]
MENTARSTGQAIELLRGDGWPDLSPGYVEYLLREGHIAPPAKVGHFRLWTESDIDRLRSFLMRRDAERDGWA